MTTAWAPGKIILLGEHSVVYGRPALAIPVRQVQACVHLEPAASGSAGWVLLKAPAIGFSSWLHEAPPDHPLASIVRAALEAVRPSPFAAVQLTVESTIPVASGLGSGAAVSVAAARAINEHFGGSLTTAQISDLAYQVERTHHGTPSGIDNTVIAYDRPIFFVRDRPPEPLAAGAPLHIVIGDTGIAAPTARAVGLVRQRWQADPAQLDSVFDSIADLVTHARQAVIDGDAKLLGSLMSRDHELLVDLGVSSPELDLLVQAADAAGALGAKMSGGGMGGNMVALASPGQMDKLAQALRDAGAVGVIRTEVAP